MGVENLKKAFTSTGSVLAAVDPDQLEVSTPCVSWNVRALINHIVGGTIYFAQVAETGTFSQSSAVSDVDYSSGDFNATFDEGAKSAVSAFSADGAMEKLMTLPFGELPGAIFVNIAATDSFTHGWDLAKATGQSTDLDPALASALLENARAFLPDAMRGEDGKAPFGPVVYVPASYPVADQLAGFLGRTP